MKLLTATIAKKPRLVDTKYGKKCVCDVTLTDGQDVTLWQPENSGIINYGNGSKISLTLDSKGKYHWVETENNTAPDNAIATPKNDNKPSYQGMNNETKKQVASYVTELCNLYNFCLKQVDQTVENITAEDRRAIATTMFISCQKKYSL